MIVRIKQNKNEYFQFLINEKNYTLDIQYNHTTKVFYKNLFLILKWYSIKEEYLIRGIYMNSSDIDLIQTGKFNLNIFRKIEMNFIKKIKFFEFKDWYEEWKNNDFEYIRNTKYYGFRVIFDKNSNYFQNKNIYPTYPWPKNYLNLWFKNEKKERRLEHWLRNQNKTLYVKWKRQSKQ